MVGFYLFIKARAACASAVAAIDLRSMGQSTGRLWTLNRSILAMCLIRGLRFARASGHFALVRIRFARRQWLVW
jgi:hypothetical protein